MGVRPPSYRCNRERLDSAILCKIKGMYFHRPGSTSSRSAFPRLVLDAAHLLSIRTSSYSDRIHCPYPRRQMNIAFKRHSTDGETASMMQSLSGRRLSASAPGTPPPPPARRGYAQRAPECPETTANELCDSKQLYACLL